MMVVGRIIGTLQTVWVVAFIIIFQPELRAALTTLGLGRGLGFGGSARDPRRTGTAEGRHASCPSAGWAP